MVITARWFPQSFVQVVSAGRTIYFDPSLTSTFGDILRSSLRLKGEVPDGLGPGSLMMVTHHHIDHLDREMITALSGKEATVLGPEACRKKIGPDMRAVVAGQDLKLDGLEVKVVDAYNPPGSRKITFHEKGEGVGYVLTVDGRRLYHAGDTGLIEEMGALGPVDIAFLPIGGRFTMDIGEAVEAVKLIRPRVVVPFHLLKVDPHEFKSRVEEETSTEVRVLAPGGSTTLD